MAHHPNPPAEEALRPMRPMEESTDGTHGIYPGWLVVLASFVGVMVGFGSLMVFTFSVFLKPLSAEFGWSREAISRAFGIAALSVAACSPKLGSLLDRYGPRKIILPCMAIYGLSVCSLSMLTSSLAQFYATFVVIGIVGNATTQMGYSRAVTTWFDRRRGFALALVMAGSGAGSILLPALAQRLIDAGGWRAAYLTLGVLILVLGIPLTALFVRERPSTPHVHAASKAEDPSASEGLRSKVFWILVGTLFFGSISVNGAVTHLSPLFTDRGISATDAALAVSTLGAFSFLGRLATGYLLDRFFGPRVAFFLMASMAGGIFLLATASSRPAGLAAAALIGIGLGGEADVTPYLLSRYFGLRSFSSLYGYTWTAYAIAGAIGPVMMGRAFDLTGSYTSFLSILAVATFASAGLMLLLPRYRALT
jgi:MFS family permease